MHCSTSPQFPDITSTLFHSVTLPVVPANSSPRNFYILHKIFTSLLILPL